MRLFAQKYLSWICFLGNLISYSQQELIQILEDEANSPFISKFGSWVFVSALIGDCELLTAFWISSTANWSSIASTMSSFAASRNHFKILKKDYFNPDPQNNDFVLTYDYRISLVGEKLLHQSKMIVFGSLVFGLRHRPWSLGAKWQIRRFQGAIERRWSRPNRITALLFQSLLSFQRNLQYIDKF